jgi:hypothetical protein
VKIQLKFLKKNNNNNDDIAWPIREKWITCEKIGTLICATKKNQQQFLQFCPKIWFVHLDWYLTKVHLVMDG